ncbi:FAD/NAD(P)-dependent oxidoreductase [Halomonas sp. NCCP-2165]|nr:NAD(P)/FAD-dependent oxidoreductase [Halomonas sp. NCCP-2165]GKW47944.1 pyridine nucleotide-disulfide oxidoreductase [Halomonas sp. NCCP-2165]
MSDASTHHADVAIIGAGPAGMAAASRLAEAGQVPVVFDLAPSPGGQIYRQLTAPQLGEDVMGRDYLRGRRLLERFERARIDYRPGSRVWWAKREGQGTTLGVLVDRRSESWQVRRLIVASGAMERGWPFPGWQLPGVMQAGAGQILLKQGALIPDVPPVLAGTGPLLYLLAWQYLRAGCPPRLILDAAPRSRYATMLRRPLSTWHGRHYLLKGLGMLTTLRRAGVKVVHGIEGLRAEGNPHLQAVHYRRAGRWQSVDASMLLTHFGVVPEPQLSRGLGLPFDWHPSQQAFVPHREEASLAAAPGIWLTGDGAGIGGALNAEREGHLAALSILAAKGEPVENERTPLVQARRRELSARALLEALFRVPDGWLAAQPETTLVCRCEAVSLGELDAAMAQGAAGPGQLKAFTRCGMGPCQGRLCGESVTRLLAGHSGTSMNAAGYYQVRPPLHSITLGELADSAAPPAP